MINSKPKTELLAPAGNYESLRAAVNNGADAVYLGARNFGARSKAGNFDRDELKQAIRYAHLYGVKVYLTLNTLLKPSEYTEAAELAKYAESVGIDAFIVQDLAFLPTLRSTMQNAEVHLSTQCGIHNATGAVTAKKLGATRIVLSRETTLADIKKIRETVDIELEYFVQGALCVSFSGNCYLSSLGAGLSGNRGKCLQFCRKKYSCSGKTGYLLSAKDLYLTEKLGELIKLGVSSFKIEGRMRKPEYVGGATAYYRAMIDGLDADKSVLKRLFNRGDYCAAYLNNPTENVIYPYIQGHKGFGIGKVASVKGNLAKLSLKKPLKKGDGIKFIRGDKEVGNALVSADGFATTFVGNVTPGDGAYLTADTQLESDIKSVKRKLPVSVSLSAVDNYIIATAEYGNASVTVSEQILEPALNAPITIEKYESCFSKAGEAFKLDTFDCSVNDKFVTVSALNEFRRKTYAALETEILRLYDENKSCAHSTMQSSNDLKTAMYGICDFCFSDSATIIQTDSDSAEKFLSHADYVAYFPKDYSVASEVLRKLGNRGILVLPVMIRDNDEEIVKKCLTATDKVMINNIGHIELCKGKTALFGPFMNVINPDFPFNAVLSPEYDGKNYGDKFAYVFGRFAVMTFAHCPNKTLNGGICLGSNCDFAKKNLTFTDENGNDFLVRHYQEKYCYAQLLNCVPINLSDKTEELGIKRRFIDFTGYGTKEALAILNGENPVSAFTRGYYRRKLA